MKIYVKINKNLGEEYEEEIFKTKSIINGDEMVFKGANIASIPFTSNEERIEWIEENAILLKDENYYYVASIDEAGDWVVERCNLHNGYLDDVDDEEINNEIESTIRQNVREKIDDIIDDDLDKLCEIRRIESEIFDGSVDYTNTVSAESDYRMAVLDDLEDDFWLHSEELKGKSSLALLNGEINHFYEMFDSRLYAPEYQVSDKEKELCSAVSHLLSDNELDKAINVLSTYSDEGIIKKIIEIDEAEFDDWLGNAFLSQHDGWNRDYWYSTETEEFWGTTETPSTSFENADSVVHICHIKGDNNCSDDAICENCEGCFDDFQIEKGATDIDSSTFYQILYDLYLMSDEELYDEENINSSKKEIMKKYNLSEEELQKFDSDNSCVWFNRTEEEIEEQRVECMANVGWFENQKNEIKENLEVEGFEIEWV